MIGLPKQRAVRVALIAAEPMFRVGFRSVIEASPDIELAAEAPDARAGFALVDRCRPNAVVIDLNLPGMNGIAAIRELRFRAPDTPVLLMASWLRYRDILDGFSAGAHGFTVKTDTNESMLAAIRMVAEGKLYVSDRLQGLGPQLLARPGALRGVDDPLRALSTREREVMDLVVRGWANVRIARELCVSPKTVDTHRSRIYRKLRCSSAADLVRFAAENGILPSACPQARIEGRL